MANNAEKILYLDQNAASCGDGTKEAPFSCLPCAFSKAKELLREATLPIHVIIDIAEGDYRIGETLTLTGEDMPISGSHLTLQANGCVTVSSLEDIPAKAFTSTGAPIHTATLLNADGTPRRFRYLYTNGRLATLALSGAPKVEEGATRQRFERDFDAKGREGANVKAECKMYLDRRLLAPLIGDKTEGILPVTDAELHTVAEWDYNIIHITAIDLNDTAVYEVKNPDDAWFIFKNEGVVAPEEHVAVYLKPDEYARFAFPGGFPFRGRHYFLQNALAFVDSENEYYRDGKSGVLSYYTEGDITQTRFAIPRLARLFSLEKIDGVTFDGLTFTGTDDYKLSEFGATCGQASCDGRFHDYPNAAAIYGHDCKHLTVKNCTFRDLGCEGVSLRGRVEDLTVKDCTFRRIPSSAIRVGAPTNRWDETAGNLRVTVENNDIDEVATVYYTSPAICMASTKDALLSHNTITNCSYSGFSVGWHWDATTVPRGERVNIDNVEISDNYVASFCTEMCDGGGIYVLGGNAPNDYPELFNFVKRNCVVYTKNTANGNGNLVCGIYFDGSSSNWHALDNVIVEQSLGAHEKDKELDTLPARYVARMQARRSGSYYCYTQHHGTIAPDHNVLWENTYLLNARGQNKEEELFEAFHGYLCDDRNCTERNTVFVHGWESVPEVAEAVVASAGCDGRKCSLDELKENRY